MRRWFHRIVLSRRWLAFIVMGLSFFGFGVGTLNLFMLLTGYLSLVCYLVFKACEYTLVRHLSGPPASGPPNV
jgi:hypothetical protein